MSVATQGYAARGEFAVVARRHAVAYGLLLVILETFACLLLSALERVHEIAGVHPHVTQMVDAEQTLRTAVVDDEGALCGGRTDVIVFHAGLVEHFVDLGHLGCVYLGHECGIFAEEYLHEVRLAECLGVEFDTAFGVGKCHLEQGGDETSGRHVMGGKEHLLLHELLNGVKGVDKRLGIRNRGGVGSERTE